MYSLEKHGVLASKDWVQMIPVFVLTGCKILSKLYVHALGLHFLGYKMGVG